MVKQHRAWRAGLIGACLAGSVLVGTMAESLDLSLSGRLDSAASLLAPGGSGGSLGWTVAGSASGWLALSAGSREAKTELRVAFNTWPVPQFELNRAWLKFRFPALRVTMGLGRLGWGTGFVLVPGDLLFDSTSLVANFAADDLRTTPAWLANLYLPLGDEAYLEFMALTPSASTTVQNTLTVPWPADVSQLAGGLRLALTPAAVLIEAAYAVDGAHSLHKVALSTQFHLGLDWYATARLELPFNIPLQFDWSRISCYGLGTLGIWDLGEGFGLTTRHEALLRPGLLWQALDLDSPAGLSASTLVGPGYAGTGLPYGWYSYHELSLAMPENLSVSARLLLCAVDWSGRLGLRLDWAALQQLSLFLGIGLELGESGDTFNPEHPAWLAISFGASAHW